MVQCFISIRQLPLALGNKLDLICAFLRTRPDLSGLLEVDFYMTWLVEASWP